MTWQLLIAWELAISVIAASAYLAFTGHWLAWLSAAAAYVLSRVILELESAGSRNRVRAQTKENSDE
jgi:hypothetical protein